MILVTGGTGLVGMHLLLQLTLSRKRTQNPLPIKSTYRTEAKRLKVQDFFEYAGETDLFKDIIWVQADITEIPKLSLAFTDVTQVYHCAALISFDPFKYDALYATNVVGTENVVNLCLANHCKKLVHLSSIATIAAPISDHATEDDVFNPDTLNSVYAITKNAAEMEAWRGTQEGLDVLIFNPGVILGEGNYTTGSGELFKKVAQGMRYYPEGSTAVIDVKDLVSILITGMYSDIKNERYITISENISYKQLTTQIAKELGSKPPAKKASKGLLKIAYKLDRLLGLFRRKRLLTKADAKALHQQTRYSNAKLISAFKYSPAAIEKTISRVASHYKTTS